MNLPYINIDSFKGAKNKQTKSPGLACRLSLLLVLVPAPRVFLRVLRFSSLHKINTPKFYFDLETVDEEPLRGNATANSIIIIMIMIMIMIFIYCILMVFTIICLQLVVTYPNPRGFPRFFPAWESCERVAKQ